MNCKDINELLTAYLDGQVTPEEREQIDAHLSICPRCREELKSLTAIQENLRQALKVTAGDVAPPTQGWAVIRRRLEGKQYGLTPWGTARSQLRAATDFVIKGLVSRQPVWKVAIIGICVVVLVALGSWMLFGRDQAHAEALVKRARMESEALASALSPGRTLHMRDQIYRRYGPAASRIMEDSWALPEVSFGDIWIRVDSDGNLYCFQSIVTDSTGNVWQESMTVDGEQVTRDVNSGEERWSPSRPYPVARFLESVVSLPERLLDKGWQWAGNGEWNGKETGVFERHSSFVNRGTDLEHGYVIPWVADLDAAETIFRFEIVIDNPLFYSEETWVANAAGDRTLVEQRRRVLVEVLDEPPPLAPCPPPYVVRTFTLADADEVLDLSSLLPSRFEHIDAASEGLSNRDLGLGPDFSEVVLFRSDEPRELVYTYLTIVDRNIDVETEFKIADGLKAGAPGDFPSLVFGTDIAQRAVWEAVRQKGGGGGGISSDEGWDLEIIRVDRILVALYRVSESPDKEPLYPLAEQIWRRISKFSQ